MASISLQWVPNSRRGDFSGERVDTRTLTIHPPQVTTQMLCTQLLVTLYIGTQNFPQNKKDLGMACHSPPLEKAKSHTHPQSYTI